MNLGILVCMDIFVPNEKLSAFEIVKNSLIDLCIMCVPYPEMLWGCSKKDCLQCPVLGKIKQVVSVCCSSTYPVFLIVLEGVPIYYPNCRSNLPILPVFTQAFINFTGEIMSFFLPLAFCFSFSVLSFSSHTGMLIISRL